MKLLIFMKIDYFSIRVEFLIGKLYSHCLQFNLNDQLLLRHTTLNTSGYTELHFHICTYNTSCLWHLSAVESMWIKILCVYHIGVFYFFALILLLRLCLW